MARREEEPNTPDSVLVRLKNKICIAMGIDVHRLKIIIDRHVMRVFNGVSNSKTHFDRINTYNELTRSRMTIKVFFKFLKMLDLKSVRISITLKTRRGQEYTVHEDINFMAVDSIKEKEEDE